MLRTFVYSIVFLVCATLTTFAQATTASKVGTASVSGRVTLGEKPAQGVVIGLMRSEAASASEMVPIARATTDSEGRYQMTGIVAGRYRVQALAPGLVSEEQKTNAFARGNALNLSDGETIENLDFKLFKGGVITGKVTDTNGRPVIATRVQLYQVQPDGRRQPMSMPTLSYFMLLTDDRGEYRMYGMIEGRYLIAVGSESGAESLSNSNLPLTYHPETTVQDEAKIITVTPGSVSENIDIRVSSKRRKGFTIMARVLDADTGQPVVGAFVGYGTARPGGGFSPANTMATSDARGNVRIEGVLPGRYGVALSSFRFEEKSSEYYSEPTPVEITDSDVEGVEIRARRGSTVRGNLVIEGVNDPALAASLLAKIGPQSIYVFSRSTTMGNSIIPRFIVLARDGSFQVTGITPGTLSFSFNTRSMVGFMLVRIEAEGITPKGEINLAAGQNLSGVKLVMAYGTAAIRGQLQVVNGALPAGAMTQATLRRTDTPALNGGGRFAEVDARGRFAFDGIPAGEYEIRVNAIVRPTTVVISSDGVSTSTTPPPAPMRPLTATQKVIVPATGETAVSVTLDVAAQQNPPKEK